MHTHIIHVHRRFEMAERIHIVVSSAEKERYRRRAAREGRTLSEWLRAAAEEKLAAAEETASLDDDAALRRFFAECDARERHREPDWEAHLAVIERSRGSAAAT
jgi:hypothetical protein